MEGGRRSWSVIISYMHVSVNFTPLRRDARVLVIFSNEMVTVKPDLTDYMSWHQGVDQTVHVLNHCYKGMRSDKRLCWRGAFIVNHRLHWTIGRRVGFAFVVFSLMQYSECYSEPDSVTLHWNG